MFIEQQFYSTSIDVPNLSIVMPSPPFPRVSPHNHHLGHVDEWEY